MQRQVSTIQTAQKQRQVPVIQSYRPLQRPHRRNAIEIADIPVPQIVKGKTVEVVKVIPEKRVSE